MMYQRADRFPHGHPHNIAEFVQIKNDDGQLIVAAHGDSGRVHHAERLREHFEVADLPVQDGFGKAQRVHVVDAVHARRLGEDLGVDFQRAQRGRGVGGEIGIGSAGGEDDDPAFFEVPDRAPANVGFRQLLHVNGGHDARRNTGLLQRILLKISGEAMAGQGSFGIDSERVHSLAEEVGEVARTGVQIGLVVGGGNFFRGVAAAARNMERVSADHMGMLATVINSLALSDALEQMGVPTRVMTAIDMRQLAEPYIRRRAIRHLEKGRIVICAAGTSNPYFSTDTAATLRALEIKAEVIAKATRVDGVYDQDPLKFPAAVKYREITYLEVLSQGLGVMDATSIAMCRDNKLPIIVFNLNTPGNIMRVAMGEPVGTVIH